MLINTEEKKIILLLVVGAIIAISVTIYLSVNRKQETLRINKRIHVLYTGGDIEPDFDEKYTKNKEIMPQFDVNVYDPQIIASDIIPQDWNRIAKDISDVYNNYDAFIIVCGRDTLAYTASAMSFMIENLGKPIIVVEGDLYETMKLAMSTRTCEVMVASGVKLLRACRTIANSDSTFHSPGYPQLNKVTALNPPSDIPNIMFVDPKIKVIVIKVFPGMDSKYIDNLKKNNMNGIVLETYGSGHAPITKEFLKSINSLVDKGVVIVNVTQCNELDVIQETDLRLLEAGVLNGYDMTTPAAFAKLHYLLGNVKDKTIIGRLMEVDFRGEIGKYPKSGNFPIK